MVGRKWGGIVPSERKLDVTEIDSLVRQPGWTTLAALGLLAAAAFVASRLPRQG